MVLEFFGKFKTVLGKFKTVVEGSGHFQKVMRSI